MNYLVLGQELPVKIRTRPRRHYGREYPEPTIPIQPFIIITVEKQKQTYGRYGNFTKKGLARILRNTSSDTIHDQYILKRGSIEPNPNCEMRQPLKHTFYSRGAFFANFLADCITFFERSFIA